MVESGPGGRSRWAAGLPPITRSGVIDAASQLTREHGLEGWTVRLLASRLEVWPAVIYHHVGDREAVIQAVTDHVVAQMPLPDADLPWREWFYTLLVDGRDVLRRHRGVARRMLVQQGPLVPSALRLIDTGVQVLQRAGLGDEEAPSVYSYLLNSGVTLIAVEDDRETNAKARATAVEALGLFRDDTEQPGLAALGRLLHREYADAESARTYQREFFAYSVQRSLDGVQVRLDELKAEEGIG
ncbi:TetR/AcrR family transcriptional regulator [Amycolatopsis sp. NPDC059027]|uniref:TetR/AcrR family transcriptional regulator n=1 Tax=unclassified Amycolatopsis TaxID=2618356 RepID=UPI00366F7D5F